MEHDLVTSPSTKPQPNYLRDSLLGVLPWCEASGGRTTIQMMKSMDLAASSQGLVHLAIINELDGMRRDSLVERSDDTPYRYWRI